MSNFDRARWTRDARLPSLVKLLLHTVISFADSKTGEAHPSISTLAIGMGVTKRTVHAAITDATIAGVLSAAESFGRRAGVRPQDTTQKFKVIDSVLAENAASANRERAQIASMQNLHPCNPCTPRMQSTHSKGAGIAPDPTNEQTNEPIHPEVQPMAAVGDAIATPDDEKVLSVVEPEGFVLEAITSALGQCDVSDRRKLRAIQTQLEKLSPPTIDGVAQPWDVVFTRALQFALASISNHAPVPLATYAKKCAISCRTTHQWPGQDKQSQLIGGRTTGKPVRNLLQRNVV